MPGGVRCPRWEVSGGFHHNEVRVYWELEGNMTGRWDVDNAASTGDGRPLRLHGMSRYYLTPQGLVYSADWHYNYDDVAKQLTLAPAALLAYQRRDTLARDTTPRPDREL